MGTQAEEGAAMRKINLLADNPDLKVDNSISTAKYQWWSFVPNNLMEQFRRLANVYFLLISTLMYIGTYYSEIFDSPLEPFSTLIPLIIVLLITMTKEGYEDSKRHYSDRTVNNYHASVLEDGGKVNSSVRWRELRVGQVVVVRSGEAIPADMVLLQTSKPDGSCYIETSNIDGETDLKTKEAIHAVSEACVSVSRTHGVKRMASQASKRLEVMGDGEGLATTENESAAPSENQLHTLAGLRGTLECQPPNAQLYKFEGKLSIEEAARGSRGVVGDHAVGYDNVLLRGCNLRNTEWVMGVVVYTGRETKVMMKAGHGKAKMSEVEKTVNRSLVVIFGTQFFLCIVTVLASLAWEAMYVEQEKVPYLLLSAGGSEYVIPQWLGDFFTFLILYNNFIPISLYVTVEMVNYIQAALVNTDLLMYDPETKTAAAARTSNLNQDLGQVEYVFSDKTGTLTRNVMEFRACSIASKVYGKIPDIDPSHGSSVDATPSVQSSERRRARPFCCGWMGEWVCDHACHMEGGDDADEGDPLLQYPPPDEEEEVGAGQGEHFGDAELEKVLGRRGGGVDHDAADAMLTVMSVCHTVVPEEVELPQGKVSRTRSRSRVNIDAYVPPSTSTSAPSPLASLDTTSGGRGRGASAASTVVGETEVVYQAESPDEGALVRAARDVGYELVARNAGSITVMVTPRFCNADWFKESASRVSDSGSGASASGDGATLASSSPTSSAEEWFPLQFRILGVHKFNSTRKRMSVVAVDPRDGDDGGAWILVKGADNVMMDLAASVAGEGGGGDASGSGRNGGIEADLKKFAEAGLRTLVLGRRRMEAKEVKKWQKEFQSAQVVVGGKDMALGEVAARYERDLEIVGATAIEDRLQEGVPDTIADLARAGIKTWVLTGDKVETAINIGRTCRLLTDELGEPIIITGELDEEPSSSPVGSISHKSSPTSSTPSSPSTPSLSAASISAADAARSAAKRRLILTQLSQAAAELDRLEAKTRTSSSSSSSSSSSTPSSSAAGAGVASSPKSSKPVSVAPSASYGALDGSGSGGGARSRTGSSGVGSDGEEIVEEESEEGNVGVGLGRCWRKEDRGDPAFSKPIRLPKALVITGAALDHIIRTGKDPVTGKKLKRDKEMEKALLKVALRCQAVVACRVSPKQKADIVNLVRNCTTPKPMTLAIGDGANDVSMIQKAQVGVGISGREGLQAVNASDFSIAQFRFLRRLLLVHGRWSYRRMSKVLLYSFYKNVVITITLFLYNGTTGWSGTSMIESLVYSIYNFVLGLPIVAIGALDRDLSERTAIRHPGVYMSGLRGLDLSVKTMAWWIFQAIVHGLIVFYIPYFAMLSPGGPIWGEDGYSGGRGVGGFTIYVCLIWAMQLKVSLITHTWTWVHIAAMLISQGGMYLFVGVYQHLLSISPDFFGVFNQAAMLPVHWFLIILVMGIVLIVDLVVQWINYNYFASTIDVAIERDAGFYSDSPQDGPDVAWGDEAAEDEANNSLPKVRASIAA